MSFLCFFFDHFFFYCLSYSVFVVFAYLFSNEGEKNKYGFGWADGKDLERIGRREIVTGVYHMEKSIFDKFKIIFKNHLVCMHGILKQQEKKSTDTHGRNINSLKMKHIIIKIVINVIQNLI